MSPQPDALAAALLATGSPLLFAAAGARLTEAWRGGTLGAGDERLADTMARRLGEVRLALRGVPTHAPTRLEIAVAAAMLAVVRPSLAPMATRTVEEVLDALPPAAWATPPDRLGVHAVLAQAVHRPDLARGPLAAIEHADGPAVHPTLCAWIRSIDGDTGGALATLHTLAARLGADLEDAMVAATAFALHRASTRRAGRTPAAVGVAVPA